MLALGRIVASQLSTPQMALAGCRLASTASEKLVKVTQSPNGVSEICMSRPPVNSLNLELLSDLKDALHEAKKSGSKGVVLCSSLSTVFSAGLDIMEMYKPDESRARKFWTTLQDTWMELYGLDLPTAAAINGSSPAGGCLLAMSCEYRAMVEGKYTIGLNETKLGIVAPPWFMGTMIDTIGQRQAELALLRGTLFTTEQAIKVGLIDDVTKDTQETMKKCHEFVEGFANIPGRARGATKANLRGARIAWLQKNRDQDTDTFINYLKNPQVQKGLDLYIQMLKKK